MLVDQVAGEVLEQVPRHRVRPVQVVEPHDDRVVIGKARDQLEDGNEQPALRDLGLVADHCVRSQPALQGGEVGGFDQQLRCGSADLAEQVGERRQRNRVAADVRRSAQVEGDIGARCALADDGCFADAGVTTDQQDRWKTSARVDDRPVEQRQLGAPTDELFA